MPEKKRLRRMHKFKITEISAVDRPAMEPALAVILKRDGAAPGKRVAKVATTTWALGVDNTVNEGSFAKALPKPRDGEIRSDFVSRFMESEGAKEFETRAQRLAVANERYESARKKARLAKHDGSVPVMTSAEDGHVHLVWLSGERGGTTSSATSEGREQWHDHPWLVTQGGGIEIGENDGHSHVVSTESLMAAMREILLEHSDAPEAVVDVVFARAPDGLEKLADSEVVERVEIGALALVDRQGCAIGDAAMPDGSFPIRCRSDLLSAIQLVDAGGVQHQTARHIVKRARVCGLGSELPEDGPLGEIAKAGHPAGDDSLGTVPEGTMSKTDPGGSGDLQKSLDAANAKVGELTKSLEAANRVASLPADQLAHYHGLESPEAKATFMTRDEKGRASDVEVAKSADKVLYKALDGAEYRASDGEKALRLAKQLDDQARRLAKSEAERASAVLAKRAEDELGNMPGDIAVRSAVLKAVDDIQDEVLRKGAMELLKAGNGVMAKRMARHGTMAGVQIDQSMVKTAEEQLEARARELMKADPKLDFYDAYDKAAERDPALAKRALGAAAPLEV